MWVVVHTFGCYGNAGAELNYFSTKAIALEFAIEALGKVYIGTTAYDKETKDWERRMLKDDPECYENMINDLRRYNGTCGHGSHVNYSFAIEIFEVPKEPEK